jgi:hypothetical protein
MANGNSAHSDIHIAIGGVIDGSTQCSYCCTRPVI